jgi:DNA invertase Pin-like site-specific DNA recombinase
MTDKEFLDLLMSYKAGTVPLLSVGLALANNQFSHEYVALANNILTAQKEQSKISRPQTISHDIKELIFKLKTEGVALESIAHQAKCSVSTVRRTLENYQQAFE